MSQPCPTCGEWTLEPHRHHDRLSRLMQHCGPWRIKLRWPVFIALFAAWVYLMVAAL